jgi:hypothetical protein
MISRINLRFRSNCEGPKSQRNRSNRKLRKERWKATRICDGATMVGSESSASEESLRARNMRIQSTLNVVHTVEIRSRSSLEETSWNMASQSSIGRRWCGGSLLRLDGTHRAIAQKKAPALVGGPVMAKLWQVVAKPESKRLWQCISSDGHCQTLQY